MLMMVSSSVFSSVHLHFQPFTITMKMLRGCPNIHSLPTHQIPHFISNLRFLYLEHKQQSLFLRFWPSSLGTCLKWLQPQLEPRKTHSCSENNLFWFYSSSDCKISQNSTKWRSPNSPNLKHICKDEDLVAMVPKHVEYSKIFLQCEQIKDDDKFCYI